MKSYTAVRTASGIHGFSLLEALLAITVAVIMLTVGIPGVGRWSQEWQLKGGAHIVETGLLWGRVRAISENTSVMLIVEDGGKNFYWADPVSGDRYLHSLRSLPGDTRIVSSPRRPLRFHQHGNAAPAGTFLVQGSAGCYRITVNPGGRIRVERI